jgi:signal transduction histidine kinase
VQHLVATNFCLARLKTEMASDPQKADLTSQEISNEVQSALNELRVFAYLLHPPELATEGLASTLRQFASGFGKRSRLQVNLRIDDEIDGAPPAFQLAILRVVQEALANVHRHAKASRVHIGTRVYRGMLFVRIGDDGTGIRAETADERLAMGVGIPGMRARLRQFNGDLKIATGAWGTAVIACVPLERPG